MPDLDPPDARIEQLLREGLALHGQMQLSAARSLYEQVLQLQPRNFRARYLLGSIALQARQPQLALELIGAALELDSSDAAAHNDYGQALYELKRYEAASASFDRAIALDPHFAGFYYNRAMALYDLAQYEAAIASFDQAIARNPSHARAFNHRGNALFELRQISAALESFASAISLNAAYAEAYNNHGSALIELEQYSAALISFDRALALQPGYADAHNNRGNALYELGKIEAALSSYDKALTLQPDYAGVHFNRGQILDELRQHAMAVSSYAKALAIKPDFKFAFGHRLLARMQNCDWHDIGAGLAELSLSIERGQAAANPFCALALLDSAALQKKAAQIWVRDRAPPNDAATPFANRAGRDKIRLGYFSADFCDHPVSYLSAELFETHDRARFEVYAFSLGRDTQDPMRRRLQRAFDRFIDVHAVAAADIAALARNLEIDIAIDLTGFTKGSRPRIFTLRAAPIQVNYLGYLGTMAAPYIDYLIADRVIVPPALRAHYTEKLAYLPSYQANDSQRRIADRRFTRHELGLPQAGFVFCCFNSNYKITPATFDSWMRILERTPGAVMFLYAASETVADNLRQEARARGVDAGRLVFGARMAPADYLARYLAADLFLDTLPYNAGATASDALWAGLPVLTCAGETFAGRMAASLLQAIGLPELITSTAAQYEDLAVALGSDAHRMAELKQKLAANRLTTALFDTLAHTRNLEAAYSQMQARYAASLPPEDICI
ncbi:MAG: tetratricopeptide repeat protein [Steroidobacteraceae bacterium]